MIGQRSTMVKWSLTFCIVWLDGVEEVHGRRNRFTLPLTHEQQTILVVRGAYIAINSPSITGSRHTIRVDDWRVCIHSDYLDYTRRIKHVHTRRLSRFSQRDLLDDGRLCKTCSSCNGTCVLDKEYLIGGWVPIIVSQDVLLR